MLSRSPPLAPPGTPDRAGPRRRRRGDIARKNAAVDCGAGRYDSGIRAMEALLRRNGYTVPSAGGN